MNHNFDTCDVTTIMNFFFFLPKH